MIGDIKAVTFDFFDTLVSHASGDGGRGRKLMEYLSSHGLQCDPWDHQVLYDVLEPHVREYAPDQAPREKQRYFTRLAIRVFQRLNVRGDERIAADHASEIWKLIGPSSLAVFPDVLPTLEHLRAGGYRLAVVSNWQCGLQHFCTELGLGDMFEHVVASAEVGCSKPNREIFLEVCRRLGVMPGQVLHVGDSPVDDVDGAHMAGMRTVLIRRGGDASPTAARSAIWKVCWSFLGYAPPCELSRRRQHWIMASLRIRSQ